MTRSRTPLGWKTCCECGVEKLLAKYYRHPAEPDGFMRHCKACHNGCTRLACERRTAALERQWGDPSEEQIAAACLRLQAGWSEGVRKRRRLGGCGALFRGSRA